MSEPTDTGDNRPSRYIEAAADGTERVIYRASSLMRCPRAFVAMSQGAYAEPIPDDLLRIFAEGHAMEPIIRGMYEEENDAEVSCDQLEVELSLGKMHGREVVIRGHIDGRVRGELTLFEAKKFRESTWEKFLRSGVECNVNYPWQVAIYMHALDLEECAFTGGRYRDVEGQEFGEVTEIYTHRITQPPIPLKAIRDRVKMIEGLCASGMVPSEVPCHEPLDYPCPYFKLHDVPDDGWELGGAGGADGSSTCALPDTPEIRDLVLSYKAASDVAKAKKDAAGKADKEKKDIADRLRKALADVGGDAEKAKTLTAEVDGVSYEIGHTIREVKEHVRKASTQDFFTIKVKGHDQQEKDK